jgi:uncharacterized protein YPO0396
MSSWTESVTPEAGAIAPPEPTDAAKFSGDTGELPMDTRRVLVHLLLGPALDAERQTKLWPVLLRDEHALRSRLHELFLDLVIDQFRLARLQTYHWGTFSGRVDIAVPPAGYLFVGPSGSGKSTLLDAHAALLTPPKWVDFNVAAREAERHGKDRNLVSYVRGAWAQQTSEGGEHVAQYLRAGTTWSAIAETYENPRGEAVTLAQVLWLRGNSTAPADVKKLYIVLPRALDLRALEFFARSDFEVRRFKSELPDAFVRDEFSPYQERFRGTCSASTASAPCGCCTKPSPPRTWAT